MKRKEFLATIGVGAAFALTSTCLGGCSKDKVEPSGDVNFDIDLTNSAFSALKEPSGFVIHEGVVIARSISGEYLAATVICSHENLQQVTFNTQDEWFCTAHGARFDKEGKGLNSNGSKGLTVYNTEKSGDILRVFS